MAIDYKDAGVDIEKGDALVDWLKEDQKPGPHADKVVGGIGGFASVFKMPTAGFSDPCLVSATDGIGTKLKLAIELESYETLGQDLVAMCANDLVCTGAQPLFFLDYFATSKLELDQAKPFLKGLRKACHDSQMELMGGETAEMPGLYQPKDFDCAGFAVGVVDRPKILGPHNVKAGQRLLGVSSSGFHSNGYSLVRKLFSGKDLKTWGETLLKPTHLYVNLAMKLLETVNVSAFAHITGGGIHNIPRVVPENLMVQLKSWDIPELFLEAKKRAEISFHELLKTFNCGVGFVVILESESFDKASKAASELGFSTYDLGEIIEGSDSIQFPSEWS